jgi:Tfp pilus assembly protein PilN
MSSDELFFQTEARPTFWGSRTGRAGHVFLATVLVLVAITAGRVAWEAAQVVQAKRGLENQLSALADVAIPPLEAAATTSSTRDRLSRLTLGETPAKDLSDEARRHLQTVIKQLNTPWQDVFDALEHNTPLDVALLGIEPDAPRDTLKLQAEARNLDTLLRYAAGLEQRGLFGRLTYSKHETNDQDANKPARLSFELELRTPNRLDVLQQPAQGILDSSSKDANPRRGLLR